MRFILFLLLCFFILTVATIAKAADQVVVTATVPPHYEILPKGNVLYINTNMDVIINDKKINWRIIKE